MPDQQAAQKVLDLSILTDMFLLQHGVGEDDVTQSSVNLWKLIEAGTLSSLITCAVDDYSEMFVSGIENVANQGGYIITQDEVDVATEIVATSFADHLGEHIDAFVDRNYALAKSTVLAGHQLVALCTWIYENYGVKVVMPGIEKDTDIRLFHNHGERSE